MPPRKSNVSVASVTGDGAPETPAGAAAAAATSTPGTATGTPGTTGGKEEKKKDKDELTVEDLALPRTMVQRLAKGVLPANTQLQRDAATALSKSATVFISHVATAAQDHTAAANRKTMSPADVFAALHDTEHAAMVPRLEAELQRFVEAGANKRNEYRRKLKERASTGAAEATGVEDQHGEREAKRVKGEGGEAVAPEEDEMLLDDEGDGEDGEEQEDQEGEEGEEEGEEEDEDGDETQSDDHDDDDPAAAQLARESRAMGPEAEASSDSD